MSKLTRKATLWKYSPETGRMVKVDDGSYSPMEKIVHSTSSLSGNTKPFKYPLNEQGQTRREFKNYRKSKK